MTDSHRGRRAPPSFDQHLLLQLCCLPAKAAKLQQMVLIIQVNSATLQPGGMLFPMRCVTTFLVLSAAAAPAPKLSIQGSGQAVI